MSFLGPATLASALGGCLLAEPAELGPGIRVPPVIDPATVQPIPLRVHTHERRDTIHFAVDVWANEADGKLIARLYRNYGLGDQVTIDMKRADPAPFGGTPGTIDFPYTFTEVDADGCYQFSLLVTHFDNVDDDLVAIDQADVALMTWWINVEVDDVPNSLADCPQLGAP